MKTSIVTALLAVAFLSAGAFANGKSTSGLAAVSASNQTIIVKNQSWPLKEMMTVEPCAAVACVNI